MEIGDVLESTRDVASAAIAGHAATTDRDRVFPQTA